jgi:hypothetical protein
MLLGSPYKTISVLDREVFILKKEKNRHLMYSFNKNYKKMSSPLNKK